MYSARKQFNPIPSGIIIGAAFAKTTRSFVCFWVANNTNTGQNTSSFIHLVYERNL